MAAYRSLAACGIALALHTSSALAQRSSCPPAISGDRVRQDLAIAARCELNGTEIDGDVTIFAGGSLTGRDVHIKGSLDASRADFVDLEGSRVDGNVMLEELVGDVTSIESTDIRGYVLLARNRSRLELVNNDIRGDVQVIGNTGGVMISGNSFDSNLECTDNAPSPYGVGNRIDDNAAGQCANLRPEPQSSPTASPTPPATIAPPATTSPATTTTPTTAAPPATTPTAASTPAMDPTFADEGGAGALGWPALLLLPLLAWRRRARVTSPKKIE